MTTERWGVMLSNMSISEDMRRKSRGEVLLDPSVHGDQLRRALDA